MIPVKPFDSYKWRWLSLAPTEGLLDAPVLLGVLRVLSRHEGQSPGSSSILSELKVVEEDTGITKRKQPLYLARDGKRNLIRNSGQYWKGTGLLAPARGKVILTPLGHRVAEGQITQGEFAAIMIQQTVLPNSRTEKPSEAAKWHAAGLSIRPFVLILAVINDLGKRHGGAGSAYITPEELISILIPLAGMKADHDEIASHIARFREDSLSLKGWPNCAPGANDHRFAREFLLFLSNFGVCRLVDGKEGERFYLDELYDVGRATPEITTSIFKSSGEQEAVIEEIRHSALPSIIERQKTTTTITKRPSQAKFRGDTFKAYSKRCYVTGEEISAVLEAAHIVPVEHGGADTTDNSLCLRVDVHRLFDTGNLRIKPSGDIVLTPLVIASKNYSILPKKIIIPKFVNPANIQWRDSYL